MGQKTFKECALLLTFPLSGKFREGIRNIAKEVESMQNLRLIHHKPKNLPVNLAFTSHAPKGSYGQRIDECDQFRDGNNIHIPIYLLISALPVALPIIPESVTDKVR
jgi:hypothetical protein